MAGSPATNTDTLDGEPTVDPKRRGLLRTMFGSFLGLGFTALGVTGGLWTAATGRMLLPNVVTEPVRRFKIGRPEDYPPDRVETKYQQEHGVWIVRGTYRGQQQIYALRTTCTHLGCITIWLEAEQKFKCPCHGSGYSRGGINIEGPAPRPLERCAIRIADDGQLEIDLSKSYQEERGQWHDPNSYVPV